MPKPSIHLRLVASVGVLRNDGPAPHIQIFTDLQRASRDALDFLGTETRHDIAPLGDGGGADLKRPSDIRGSLKVIKDVSFKHVRDLTTVQSLLQPQSIGGVLTSVNMETLNERLKAAMGSDISASDLARACGVSPAAVSKWLEGRTKALKADTLSAAARALGVREDWLRTGRLPRERAGAQDERQIDQVLSVLQDLQGPLASLLNAIEKLNKSHKPPTKKQASG